MQLVLHADTRRKNALGIDALVYTVKEIEGSGIERMTQNFRRWSGNMLRNGSRALKLGPTKVG